jgi:hypothetical protein
MSISQHAPGELLGERGGFLGNFESDAHHEAVGALPPGEDRRVESHLVEPLLPHLAHGSDHFIGRYWNFDSHHRVAPALRRE